jgi:O-antigen ligase
MIATMLFRSAATGLKRAAITLLLVVLIFSDRISGSNAGFVDSGMQEIAAILRDPGTQWMVFFCFAIYFAAFLLFRSRKGEGFWGIGNPALWLACMLGMGAGIYALNYSPSAQALTLLAGSTLGCGVAVWVEWENRKRTAGRRSGAVIAIIVLMLILLSAALWQAESAHVFQYRDRGRWTGPWDNPNIFGLLMGAGMALALGSAECGVRSAEYKKGGRHRFMSFVAMAFCLLAVVAMGVGLLKSYSRGAWVGTLVGVACLVWSKVQSSKFKVLNPMSKVQGRGFAWFGRGWVRLSVILACAVLLCFWGLRQTNWHPVQRVVSVANANDFSWRNRVLAWEGTLQMMVEKPWFGFGWEKSDQVYDKLYRSNHVIESGATQMNDYFTLGTTLGIPALACFVAYVGLCLSSPKFKVQSPKSGKDPAPTTDHRPLTTDYWLRATCRAGAIVLLVGFWFDGGLFKLPTATVFWILIELGREDLTAGGLSREEAQKPQIEMELLKGKAEG